MKKEVILGERYEVISKIGAGGMADVYKGKDTMLNRYIAIKVLKKEYREDETFVRKFRSEAQAAAGLMHPNIVNVYDVGEDRGLYYMVMELVEGITLKSYIDKKGALSAREVISIAIQMCAGIEAAHKHHIIHRDIKPQNIMISKDGKVKVTDFGIARATTSHTVSSNAMGSVHYTSPEQARGGISDAKSDIYSVGITLYEMITGELPFDGDSTVSIAIKHLQEEITPPSEHVANIPYSLEQIILKCTLKSADRRYASIPELVQDLKRSLVDPEGNFVKMAMFPNNDETIMMTSDELSQIQEIYHTDDLGGAYGEDDDDDFDDDDFDDDDYDDDYDDDDYDDEDDDEDETALKKDGKVNPRMNKVMKTLTIVVAVILVLVVGLIVGQAAGVFKFFDKGVTAQEDDGKVEVPDVRGMKEADAKKKLNDMDLTCQVSERKESSQYDKGLVSEQTVKPGDKVDKRTMVHIVVSTGKTDEVEKKKIPDVSGLDEDEAHNELQEAGFDNITTDFDYSDDTDSSKVIKTTPGAGDTVKTDTEITIWVSKGAKKPDRVTVPSIVGKSETEAKSLISDAGLSVGNTSSDYNDAVQEGYIISQSPTSGKLDIGSSVSYVVSKGKKPVEKRPVPYVMYESLGDAKKALEEMGFVVVALPKDSSDPKDTIIDCNPSANTKLEIGATVTIYYSTGEGDDVSEDDY